MSPGEGESKRGGCPYQWAAWANAVAMATCADLLHKWTQQRPGEKKMLNIQSPIYQQAQLGRKHKSCLVESTVGFSERSDLMLFHLFSPHSPASPRKCTTLPDYVAHYTNNKCTHMPKQERAHTRRVICSTTYRAMLPWKLLAEIPSSLSFTWVKKTIWMLQHTGVTAQTQSNGWEWHFLSKHICENTHRGRDALSLVCVGNIQGL